ncbi:MULTISPECIES: CopG family antitoxin [unclassified Candidatus Tisiphia]|uniref:CopG family antitoxin n=1 Tax=unclassified Candidatus Tisiphia TaxID=2996318 RepID=UPI00312CC257|nr:CopG family antitoxin [Rickettsiaceae bacterium]MDD9336923.1 CopG family antitoxin [Rickettsiaceae bacterium]
MSYKLDKYEQDIEINFEEQPSIKNQNDIKLFQNAAKTHLKRKHPITIRVAEQDIEAIKIKASKLGLAYQTYINMLIHKEATKL